VWMRVQVLLRDGDRIQVVREPARSGAGPDGGCLKSTSGRSSSPAGQTW
jgi:hypothetical protein